MSGLKKSERGHGLLRRETYSWSIGDKLTRGERKIVERRMVLDTFEGRCENIDEWIRWQLVSAGLPEGQGPWFFDEAGRWWPEGQPDPIGAIPPFRSASGSPVPIALAMGLDDDAPAMQAIRMRNDIHFARRAIADKNFEKLGIHAFYLGMEWARMGLNAAHGRTFENGEKQIQTLHTARSQSATARRKARSEHWDEWIAEANAIWQRNSTLKKTEVARRVKAELGLSETIRAIANRIGKAVIESSRTKA